MRSFSKKDPKWEHFRKRYTGIGNAVVGWMPSPSWAAEVEYQLKRKHTTISKIMAPTPNLYPYQQAILNTLYGSPPCQPWTHPALQPAAVKSMLNGPPTNGSTHLEIIVVEKQSCYSMRFLWLDTMGTYQSRSIDAVLADWVAVIVKAAVLAGYEFKGYKTWEV